MDARSFVITGAKICDPSQNLEAEKDLWIEDGKIKAIEQPGSILRSQPRLATIDAQGMLLLPGFVDLHVHLREPGEEFKESIETGTLAAVAGGITSVACMANTIPVNDHPRTTRAIIQKAQEKGACNLYPVGAVSKGLKGEELAEIGGMVRAGARAVSDDGIPISNAQFMRKALEYCKMFDIPIISHAEDPNLVCGGDMSEGLHSYQLGLRGNPSAAEEIMVSRDISLARLTGGRVHFAHVSSHLSLEHIRRAKEEGLLVTAEVTPHHLLLASSSVGNYLTYFKMAPPLREQHDNETLCAALESGVIDAIATDHAPHHQKQKETTFHHAACGVTGLETGLAATYRLVLEKKLSLKKWVSVWTQHPAKILGISSGTLRPGSIADCVLFDSEKTWTVAAQGFVSKSSNSAFVGLKLRGKVNKTFVKGILKFEDERGKRSET